MQVWKNIHITEKSQIQPKHLISHSKRIFNAGGSHNQNENMSRKGIHGLVQFGLDSKN